MLTVFIDQLFLRAIEEVSMWMKLAKALLTSEDLGKDLQSIKFLLKKHQVDVYVFVFVCLFVCVCVCVRVCVRACVHARTRVYVCMHICVDLCMHLSTHKHLCVYFVKIHVVH